MTKKKPQIKLASTKNNEILHLEAKIRMLETMIYKMANDIEFSTAQLITLAQILDKKRGIK